MNAVWRLGYTTGTCATAAAKAAALALVTNHRTSEVEIGLPNGERATLPVLSVEGNEQVAVATVRKEAGDDPDVTDQLLVQVTLERGSLAPTTKDAKDEHAKDEQTPDGANPVVFRAGAGVGTITLPGLAFPPGEPAINPYPRRQIIAALREVTTLPLVVTVSIPGGDVIAARTFNPRLGVEGGLSILGTDGRVRPFSHPRLVAALKLSADVAKANAIKAPVLVPGHQGRRHAKAVLRCSDRAILEVANEVGTMLDYCRQLGMTRVLLFGHPGKLAKVIFGDFDTHSSRSRSATEAVLASARQLALEIAQPCPTTEALFMSLPEPARRTLGAHVAAAVRRAVEARFEGLDVAVWLTNLAGEPLGLSGAVTTWT